MFITNIFLPALMALQVFHYLQRSSSTKKFSLAILKYTLLKILQKEARSQIEWNKTIQNVSNI